ncbi:MAG: hypothetical protein ACR2JK_02230 [Geodermatophilaceae bacterium]
MKQNFRWPVAVGLVAAGLIAGCGQDASSPPAAGPSTDTTPPLATAPDSARVDLEEPTFSDPTTITNPLFPINTLTQVVQIGSDADGSLRHDITLLPETKIIEWNGESIETVVSQFMAYSDGRILELATDYFAQADDGSVWYFGEDVANYVEGVLDNHDGTWLAGRDGPPGMIMPAHPQVGDVYRPENIPGLVFEEVVVKSVDERPDGPQGPIAGAVLVEEHPMDGAIEDKTFAPGYGEFFAQVVSENEVATVSVGVPTDALGHGIPAELAAISSVTDLIGPITDWPAAGTKVDSITTAWESYRSDATPLTAEQVDQALAALRTGVEAQDESATQMAAFDLAYAATDLRLRHEGPAAADRYRMDIIARQAMLDATAEDGAFVAGDAAAMQSIWDRVRHTAADPVAVDGALDDLRSAADAADLAGAGDAADRLRTALTQL